MSTIDFECDCCGDILSIDDGKQCENCSKSYCEDCIAHHGCIGGDDDVNMS